MSSGGRKIPIGSNLSLVGICKDDKAGQAKKCESAVRCNNREAK